ncbi:MAG: efflux RND transporter periplasmic adaptor subunit [Bryobacter sp.]|nr:efflux RND transporter periplasmic adaptor subunit [Bryobacter sp.]
MAQDLSSLRIDKSMKASSGGGSWATRWILIGVAFFLLLGAAATWNRFANAEVEVKTARAMAAGRAAAGGAVARDVVLNATGYIVAHHKIQLASKVVGKVARIGVEKGDRVRKGQEIVRLEDDEYRAQLEQAKGQLESLEARLLELRNGSRPEEIAAAKANWEQAKADLENARVQLERTLGLVRDGVLAKSVRDDAQARFDSAKARALSLERTYELVKIGPRAEVKQQVEAQIREAKGRLDFFQTQLKNTVIRAPIDGTILERIVELGEFVTTGFVGDRGAKGYVVSLADLNDLQVELDINQADFARLDRKQRGSITTDAYKDRSWEGVIDEIAPEANRQKATVQVKVKVLNPDEFLRPEMNASVAFYNEGKGDGGSASAGTEAVYAPAAAVRDGVVFAVVNGKAVRRPVETGPTSSLGVRVEKGLIGGEELVLNPPAELKDGAKVKVVN